MNLVVVGTNHKYSPIEIRERLSFSNKRIQDALLFLKESSCLEAGVILSTCNRVEIYASSKRLETAVFKVIDFLSRYHEIDKERFSPYLYIYKDRQALKHLLTVACGLDSLILGETQILGQIKQALFEAESVGFTNDFLRVMFYHGIYFARKIHRETKISEGKVSVGSVAIDFIKERLGGLSGKNILIIGVGKVTTLVLKYLKEEKPNVVFISNRTFEKAKVLAGQIGAKAVRFDALPYFLNKADVVITATASPHFILKKETLEPIINHRLLIIDLGLPRNVDSGVKEIKNIELFSLEDLEEVIKKSLEIKKQEAIKVKEIINKELGKIWEKFTELELEPVHLL